MTGLRRIKQRTLAFKKEMVRGAKLTTGGNSRAILAAMSEAMTDKPKPETPPEDDEP